MQLAAHFRVHEGEAVVHLAEVRHAIYTASHRAEIKVIVRAHGRRFRILLRLLCRVPRGYKRHRACTAIKSAVVLDKTAMQDTICV